MVLLGPLVNGAAIIMGAIAGRIIRLPEQFQQTIMQALGLAIMIIGISMGITTANILIPIAALLLGSILGELCRIEVRVAQMGNLLRRSLGDKKSAGDFTQGFLTATLVFCVGGPWRSSAGSTAAHGRPSNFIRQINSGWNAVHLLRHRTWYRCCFFGAASLSLPREHCTFSHLPCSPPAQPGGSGGDHCHRRYFNPRHRAESAGGVNEDQGRQYAARGYFRRADRPVFSLISKKASGHKSESPFAHGGDRGIRTPAFCMRSRRAPSCAISPP